MKWLTRLVCVSAFALVSCSSNKNIQEEGYDLQDVYLCLAESSCGIFSNNRNFSFKESDDFKDNSNFIESMLKKSFFSSSSADFKTEKKAKDIFNTAMDSISNSGFEILSHNKSKGMIFYKSETYVDKKIFNYEWNKTYLSFFNLEKDIENGEIKIFVSSSPAIKLPLSKLFESRKKNKRSKEIESILLNDLKEYIEDF